MADEETQTTPETPAPAPAAPAAPPLAPKARREARRARSRPSGPGEQRTLEQRLEQRADERRRKAVVRTKRRLAERTRARTSSAAATAAQAAEGAPVESVHVETVGRPKVRQGVVVSAKPDKTITVRIDVARRHQRYEKIVRSSSTIHAHDERNDAGEGDTVRVIECRPLSRLKRWRLIEILERAK